jgi:hypothetical protein
MEDPILIFLPNLLSQIVNQFKSRFKIGNRKKKEKMEEADISLEEMIDSADSITVSRI